MSMFEQGEQESTLR